MRPSNAKAQSSRGATGLPAHAYGLDLIRLAAALMVALFHFTWTSPQMSWLLPVGWIGVPVFFVLSGLVIANSASNATPREFLVRRFLRLYPAAWICAAISIAVILLAGDAIERSGVGTYLSASRIVSSFLLFGSAFITSAYWSLPIEIVFYGLVLLVIATRGPGALLTLGRGLILWAGVFLTVRIVAQFGLIPAERLDLGFGLRNATLLRHGHYFGLGIILFALARDRVLRPHIPWIAMAAFFAVVETAWRAEHFMARQGHLHDVPPVTIVALAIWAALCLAMVASVRSDLKPAPWASGSIRALGLATYPFYLLHEALGGAVIGSLGPLGIAPGLCVVAGILVPLVVSLAICQAAEPRLRALLRSLLLRPRPA